MDNKFGKLTIGDRFLMSWYWFLSIVGKYYYQSPTEHFRSKKIDQYLWRYIRENGLEISNGSFTNGDVQIKFDGDLDFRSIFINEKYIDIGRSLQTLLNKEARKVKVKKEKYIEDEKSMIDSIIDAHTTAKGL